MSYSVEKKEKEYYVKEKDTGQVVWHCTREIEARKVCRSLNLGSGFNGFTPNFFCKEMKRGARPDSTPEA